MKKMNNKFWTIRYVDMEGKENYAKVISMSASRAILWAVQKFGISSEQIDYMSGEEAEIAL